MMPDHHIRISEWAKVSVDGLLSPAQREAVAVAVDGWRDANTMPVAPLSFAGPCGDQLCARQFVGVVEVGDVSIEIFPKLDSHLLQADRIESDLLANSVMQNLMWMLEISGYMDVSEIDTAHLQEYPVSFYDIFAYLMAKNLLDHLSAGVPHAYVTIQDDLRAVKGRINIREQVTLHWNRLDRIACTWDEFTADIPLNRIFKCACRLLFGRVANPVVSSLLQDCLMYLDQVTEVAPEAALQAVECFRPDRSNERLKMCFDMAVRLLSGAGYNMDRGDSDTFVFLIDMNQLFEDYAARIAEIHFGIPVHKQEYIGKLFERPQRLKQYPDFLWKVGGQHWIGDAKYKHLAKGQDDSLMFDDLDSDTCYDDSLGTSADRILCTNDVRQLIVYSELLRQRAGVSNVPTIAILYPFIGTGAFRVSMATAFTGAEFWMVPVKVKRISPPSAGIPDFPGIPLDVKQVDSPKLSPMALKDVRLAFWRAFCQMAEKQAPGIGRVKPTDEANIEFTLNDDEFRILSRAEIKKSELSVCLDLQGDAAAEQLAMLNRYFKNPDEPLHNPWMSGNKKLGKGFRVTTVYKLNLNLPETWEEQHQWIVCAVREIHNVMIPLIKKIPARVALHK